MRDMTDEETAEWLRKWCSDPSKHTVFGWPTDACGYHQHIKFVDHRNKNWNGGHDDDFIKFVLAYANSLCPAR